MKKQLLIKKKVSQLSQDIKQILFLIKNINKNAVFFTQNNIILNPVIVFGDKFFIVQLNDNYKIITKKQQWRIPSYVTDNINKIRQIVQNTNNLNPGSYLVDIKQNSVEYTIPISRIVQKNEEMYYRLNFHSIYKETQSRQTYYHYVQQNGRLIKPIFSSKNIKSFVSTSPIIQTSVQYDKLLKIYTYIISKYSIDTITGIVIKAVQKAYQQGQTIDLQPLYKQLIQKRTFGIQLGRRKKYVSES